MFWIWEGAALAGQLVCGSFDTVNSVNTRAMTSSLLGQFGGGVYEAGDLAVDASAQMLFVSGIGSFGNPQPCIFEFDPRSGTNFCGLPSPHAGIAFDSFGNLLEFPNNTEYFPPLNEFIGLSGYDNAIMSSDSNGFGYRIAPYPQGFTFLWFGAAWDADLKVLWLLGGSFSEYNFVALEPTNFTPVIYSSPDLPCYGATGAFDDVPRQTPALFVSGECPGELTVTIADATPGESVSVLSSGRLGGTRVPAGTCSGTRTGLGQPRLRTTLVADSYGIATTQVQATPGMCGATLLQAVDVGSCLTTDVVGVPAPVVP